MTIMNALATRLPLFLLFLQQANSFLFQHHAPRCTPKQLTVVSRDNDSIATCTCSTQLRSSNEDVSDTSTNRISRQQEQFMERESKNGADKVRSMSIEERTKRAMLAEAAEDRIMQFSDELDALLGEDGMPKSEEDREEVVRLCEQIKATQSQYSALVNGEESALLNALDGKD